MNKKQFDRRPDEKPAEQGTGTQHDPITRRPGEHPEGHPIDEPTPKPGTRLGRKEILEGERSDRASGRPVQLEDDEERQTVPPGQPGRADSEPGLGGRPQEGRQDRRSREGEPTER